MDILYAIYTSNGNEDRKRYTMGYLVNKPLNAYRAEKGTTKKEEKR